MQMSQTISNYCMTAFNHSLTHTYIHIPDLQWMIQQLARCVHPDSSQTAPSERETSRYISYGWVQTFAQPPKVMECHIAIKLSVNDINRNKSLHPLPSFWKQGTKHLGVCCFWKTIHGVMEWCDRPGAEQSYGCTQAEVMCFIPLIQYHNKLPMISINLLTLWCTFFFHLSLLRKWVPVIVYVIANTKQSFPLVQASIFLFWSWDKEKKTRHVTESVNSSIMKMLQEDRKQEVTKRWHWSLLP